MDRTTCKTIVENLEVFKAWIDGATVETLTSEGNWIPCPNPKWDGKKYRVKPVVREYWVNVYPSWTVLYDSKEKADAQASCYSVKRIECIHVREILTVKNSFAQASET